MRYRRVLFVIPPMITKPQAPVAGVGYLSTFLTRHDIDNGVLDMNLGYELQDLLKRIDHFTPDLVALPVMTGGRSRVYDLIREIMGKRSVDVVVGGHHVSTERSKVLEECPAKYAIKLEGEFPLRDLCLGVAEEEIPGLIFRRGSGIVENPDPPFIEDLDRIPFPTYEKFELHRYPLPNGIPLVSSRGCPYSCVFCSVKLTIGRRIRVRSPENVVAELDYWHRKGHRVFGFQDDNFTFYRDRVLAVCRQIKEAGLGGLRLNCPNGVRADRVDRELLEQMREAGFKLLAFGVEGGNDKVLTNLKKGENMEAIEGAVRDACDLGFDVVLFFLVGSPGETPADVEDSVNLALRYPVVDAFFYNLIPYPHTELFSWIEQNGLFLQAPGRYFASGSAYDNEPKFATPEFPAEERKRALLYTKSVRKQIRFRSIRRRLPRWALPKGLWSRLLASDFGEKRLLASRTFWRLARYIRPA